MSTLLPALAIPEDGRILRAQIRAHLRRIAAVQRVTARASSPAPR